MASENSKHKVHWLCWVPTPYNDHLFRSLAEDPEIDLIVHYRERVLSSHPWQTRLAQGYRNRYYRCALGIDWRIVTLPFTERNSFFVIGGWNHATAVVLINILNLFRKRFAIWTDTPNLTRRRDPIFGFFRSVFLKWAFLRAEKVMGTGLPAVDALRDMGIDRAKLINFPYGVDLDSYFAGRSKTKSCSKPQTLYILSAGRLNNSLKGHDIALKALAKAASFSEVKFVYSLAGVGQDLEVLKELAQYLGIGDQVNFCGWVEPDELVAYFRKADIVIHSSPVHEPYGVAVIEGMAASCVVLASDVTCSALDRIENCVNGFIHPAGDVQALAEQIEFLFKNPERIPEIGKKARETAEQWTIVRGIKAIKEVVCAES